MKWRHVIKTQPYDDASYPRSFVDGLCIAHFPCRMGIYHHHVVMVKRDDWNCDFVRPTFGPALESRSYHQKCLVAVRDGWLYYEDGTRARMWPVWLWGVQRWWDSMTRYMDCDK